MAAFARERQQIFMVALFTFNPGKAKVRIAAFQVFVYNIYHKRAEVAEFLLVFVLPGSLQLFIMILHNVEIYAVFRITGPITGVTLIIQR